MRFPQKCTEEYDGQIQLSCAMTKESMRVCPLINNLALRVSQLVVRHISPLISGYWFILRNCGLYYDTSTKGYQISSHERTKALDYLF